MGQLVYLVGSELAWTQMWVVARVEWVWALGIVGVMVKECVHGSNVEARILAGMVACQARSQGRQNLTPLDLQRIALVHPETGLQ